MKEGAITIGHPLGTIMIRLIGILARTLKEKKAKYLFITVCIGDG